MTFQERLTEALELGDLGLQLRNLLEPLRCGFFDLALLSAAGVGVVGLLLLSLLVDSRIKDSRAAATAFQPKMEHEDVIVVVAKSTKGNLRLRYCLVPSVSLLFRPKRFRPWAA